MIIGVKIFVFSKLFFQFNNTKNSLSQFFAVLEFSNTLNHGFLKWTVSTPKGNGEGGFRSM